MKTKCLIVDDEPLAIEVLENHISQLESLEVAATCRNAITAFEILETRNIDLLFLDIQMPRLTGIDLLRSIKDPPKVIFTTAYIDHALEGFELDVLDYLVKPISFKRFLKAIRKYFNTANLTGRSSEIIKHESTEIKDHIFVKSDRKNHKILFSDILYIESVKDYIKIHTNSGSLVVKHTLSSFEEELPEDFFIRIHRSYIVNLKHITAYTAHDIEIDSEEIPIGISYKQKVFEKLA
ncbi:MAG: LytTR family DNA-binding domain-containing protein [Pyrinomonadaceae bacterium]